MHSYLSAPVGPCCFLHGCLNGQLQLHWIKNQDKSISGKRSYRKEVGDEMFDGGDASGVDGLDGLVAAVECLRRIDRHRVRCGPAHKGIDAP